MSDSTYPEVTIAISGPARSGKDTASEYLAYRLYENYNILSTRMALADSLKVRCAELLGIDVKDFYNTEKKEILRPFLQWYGTEFAKNPMWGGYESVWVDQLRKNYIEMKKDEANKYVDVLIVSDVRFDNEVVCLKNFTNTKFISLNLTVLNPIETTHHTSHSSEAGVNQRLITDEIMNNQAQGLEVYKQKLDSFVKSYDNVFKNLANE